MTVFPDGTALFSMLRFGGGYTGDIYYVQTRDGQIIKQRKKHHTGVGHPYEPVALRFQDGSDVIIRQISDSVTNQTKIEVLKMHTSDTSSACIGFDDGSTVLHPFKYQRMHWTLDSVRSNLFYENGQMTITTLNLGVEKEPGCFTVSHCDSLKLTAAPVVCLSQPLEVTVRKNKACGSWVPIRLDTIAIQSLMMVNDSTYSIRFKKPWSGYISGSLQGCSLIWDSVYVQVLQTPDILHLGADRELCPGNTIRLNARSGYASYQWQDGSTDSIFTVTQPGLYHVTTTDACGGVYKDSVTISPAPPIPFNAGSDRTKCNDDTLRLTAPLGFLNYTWSNNYNISSLTSQTVIVNPSVDTAYYIRAEKTPGCFAYDTVRITVFHSLPINLGRDTSFCTGDSIRLNAGDSFQSYLWSDGSSQQTLTVKTKGWYEVNGTTAQGCKSYDTLQVVQVYALPVVRLDKGNALCSGETKTLDAGAFSAYHWQDGSPGRSYTVTTTGTYSVTVQDNNGCVGKDTTVITTIHPLSKNFLPSDTAICSYGTLELKPITSFTSYLWNTGGRTPAITISRSGLYWLEVQDNNNCKGRDSIIVNPKQCLSGFYIPNAFTPNGDGKNDVFRPQLFGNVKKCQFTIYNRWGQMVFQTSEPGKGWNGIIGGILQETGVFVWTCTYQIEGEGMKAEKGTVTIIR